MIPNLFNLSIAINGILATLFPNNWSDHLLSLSLYSFLFCSTMAIGSAGASNAALMALEILALNDQKLAQNLETWRNQLSSSIPDEPKN